MKKILFALIFVIALSLSLSADYYIKTQTHTDAMEIMGQKQPATDTLTEQWFSSNMMAQIMPKISTIIDMSKKMIYIISHGDKSYVETPYPLDMTKLIDPQYKAMVGMMKVSIKVTPNGKTQKIGQWNCTGYDMDMSVTMMTIKSKVWATTDVPFDWKMYSDLAANSMMQILDAASVEELKKIKGVHILSEMNMEMMGSKISSNSKVAEIAQKAAPAGVYAVPAGYTKKASLDMAKMR